MRFTALLLLVTACPMGNLPNTPPQRVATQDEGSKSVARCLASSPEEKRVTTAVTSVHGKGGAAIKFRFTNVSPEPLRVYAYQLPWGNLNAVQYEAVTMTGGHLSVGWPIDDPGPPEIIVLEPGKSIEGEVSLRYRIREIDDAALHSDVNVNWCYHFTAVGEEIGGHLSGTVKVPRRAV